MSNHKTPLTKIEREGLIAHGLGRYIGKPSQLMTTITTDRARLEELLGEYWEIAFEESSGVVAIGNKANRVLHEIRALFDVKQVEVARLKAESEERLQNCAALLAEVERLRAAPATAPAQPSWHDAPTVPGLWVSDFSWMAQKLDRDTVEFYAKNRSLPSRRWYGPIPEDKQ